MGVMGGRGGGGDGRKGGGVVSCLLARTVDTSSQLTRHSGHTICSRIAHHISHKHNF